ncbi:MAG: hypothetical protein CL843_15930 [Crocinitomicaceae bacterium]|nr:hypothetical protein [Crocinitomicaceae bacterium]
MVTSILNGIQNQINKIIVGAVSYGVIMAVFIIIYHLYTLKKEGVSFSNKMIYKNKPNEELITTYNLDDIEQLIRLNPNFKLITKDNNDQSKRYFRRKINSFYDSIIEIKQLPENLDQKFHYSISAFSNPRFVIFDLGKNYLSLIKFKQALN